MGQKAKSHQITVVRSHIKKILKTIALVFHFAKLRTRKKEFKYDLSHIVFSQTHYKSKREEKFMVEQNDKDIPLGQKLLEKPFLLLGLGIVIMAAFYTLWGLAEIVTLPKALLP